MTKKLEAFFAQCRRVRWTIRHGQVRTRSKVIPLAGTGKMTHCASYQCPLSYVTGHWGQGTAAETAGIQERVAIRIAAAADDNQSRSREWLLEQLGA